MKEQQKKVFIENIALKCQTDEQKAKEIAEALIEIQKQNAIAEQTLLNDVFLTKFALYLKVGREVALDWVRKNKELDTPFPEDVVELQPVEEETKSVKSVEEKPDVQIYGAMTVGSSKVRKQLLNLKADLLKEVVEKGSVKKSQKLGEYIFDQLARRLEEVLSKEQKEDLYNRIRGGKDLPFSEDHLQILNDQIIPELKDELSNPDNGHVNILGLDVSREDKYTFDTTDVFSVWFSNNPALYMPEKVKAQVEKTAQINQPGKTRIVYSSLCLNEKAQLDFQQWAKEKNVELVDIDSIDLESVSETDAQMLTLAKYELESMRNGKGGNPAAASDLVRWVESVIGKSSTYIDIDLPMKDNKVTAEVHAGFPVLLNMGSALTKQGAQPAMENPAFNTDMIAYSTDHEARRQVTEGVAKNIIARYENCAKTIEESKHEDLVRLRNSPGYQLLHETTDGTFDLCTLRLAVANAHKDALSYATFFGAEHFAKLFASQELVPVIQEAIKHQNQELLTSIIQSYIEKRRFESPTTAPENIQQLLKSLQGNMYKPLVMEFSGPSAVSSSWIEAISGKSMPRNFEFLAEPMSQPLRVLQHHACISEKTNFSSDNIPAWCELQSEVEKRQQERKDGLSWLPAAQEALKKERLVGSEFEAPKVGKVEVEQESTSDEVLGATIYQEQSHAIDLILKDFENKIDSIGTHHEPAKQIALDLLKTLRDHKAVAFHEPSNEKLTSFAKKAKEAIREATPILQKDLGWGDYLANLAKQLVNAVTTAVAYVVTLGASKHQGFFAVKPSDAVKKSQELEQQLDDKLVKTNPKV